MSNLISIIPKPNALPRPSSTAVGHPSFSLTARFVPWFWGALGLLLAGYAIFGRPFAGLGISPLYVGELTLCLGVLALLTLSRRAVGAGIVHCLPLMAFMAWGAFRTLPYVGEYGLDALRDAVLWGYGLYALILVALLLDEPTRMIRIVEWYRAFARLFLMVAPLVALAAMVLGPDRLPTMPLSDVPVLDAKAGDMAAHFAGVLTFAVMVGGVPTWLMVGGGLSLLGLVSTGRSAMLAAFVGISACFVILPRNGMLGRMFLAAALVVVLLWAADIKFSPDGSRRPIDVESVAAGLWSIVGSSDVSDYDGTKEWRLHWWGDILDYTFGGDYFWTGKGYGVNLANSDGYQVEHDDDPLRSPHNGHLTVLARSGVPGFSLWVLMNGIWIISLGIRCFQCRAAGNIGWERVILVIGTLGVAFLLNAGFDVFLEGPMGGIWFWSIFGVGLAAVHLSRTHPHLLDDQITAANVQS